MPSETKYVIRTSSDATTEPAAYCDRHLGQCVSEPKMILPSDYSSMEECKNSFFNGECHIR